MSSGIELRVGPYHHAPGFKAEREVKGKTFVVLIAGAYNAGGMVGPEMNGIAVLNKTDSIVCLDQHMKVSTGYFGPTPKQIKEWRRVLQMRDAEFVKFCTSNPGFREGSMGSLEKAKAPDRRTLMQLHAEGVSYNYDNKRAWALEGKRLLTALAKEMDLPKGTFDIRYNAAGIACSGDHTLHADTFYLTFNADLGRVSGYVRECNGRQDYSGGRNINFDPSELYTNMSGVAERLKEQFVPVARESFGM